MTPAPALCIPCGLIVQAVNDRCPACQSVVVYCGINCPPPVDVPIEATDPQFHALVEQMSGEPLERHRVELPSWTLPG